MGEVRTTPEAALSGQGRLIMLACEPGVDKTLTAQELAAHATYRRMNDFFTSVAPTSPHRYSSSTAPNQPHSIPCRIPDA